MQDDPTVECLSCLGLPECVGGCPTCGGTGEVPDTGWTDLAVERRLEREHFGEAF
jgi:hypothetical protein